MESTKTAIIEAFSPSGPLIYPQRWPDRAFCRDPFHFELPV